MAKDKTPDKGKAKVRIFYAEVEGGDETIKDGIRSIGQSWVRAVQPPVVMRGQPQAALPASDSAQPSDAEAAETEVVGNEPEVIDAPETDGVPRPKRPKKSISYSIIGGLDLRPSDKQCLKDFFAEKQPSDQQEQMVVIVYYLSKILRIDKVTADHVFSGFDEVDQRAPLNIMQIVRNIQRRKGWLEVSESKGIEITVGLLPEIWSTQNESQALTESGGFPPAPTLLCRLARSPHRAAKALGVS